MVYAVSGTCLNRLTMDRKLLGVNLTSTPECPCLCFVFAARTVLSAKFHHYVWYLDIFLGHIVCRDLEYDVGLVFRYRFLTDCLDELVEPESSN
jgi:hypothetical protein